MKDLKVSNETHSLLFSIKNKLIVSHNKKFTFDEVMKVLIQVYSGYSNASQYLPDSMYQLEEKP